MIQQATALPLLQEARQRFTQRDLAAKLSVAPKTPARFSACPPPAASSGRQR